MKQQKQRFGTATMAILTLACCITHQTLKAQSEMKTKKTHGSVKLAYSESGQGDTTLLLLPGWCANRTKFEPLLPYLSKKYHVISMDWRGHGESDAYHADFGTEELLQDALEIIHETQAQTIIPISVAHAGWVSIKLKEQLAERVPKLVFIDWMVMEAPPAFLDALKAMQSPDQLKPVLDVIFEKWIGGVQNPQLSHFVKEEMGAYPFEMWSRGAKAIQEAYTSKNSPLAAISQLLNKPEVFHVYGQPDLEAYYQAQLNFAQANNWFSLKKLNTKSHFPMFEIPEELSQILLEFIAR